MRVVDAVLAKETPTGKSLEEYADLIEFPGVGKIKEVQVALIRYPEAALMTNPSEEYHLVYRIEYIIINSVKHVCTLRYHS